MILNKLIKGLTVTLIIMSLSVGGLSYYNHLVTQQITKTINPEVKLNGQEPVVRWYQQGTGFLIDADGDVATAAHVIHGSSSQFVYYDGHMVAASVVYKNERADIAIIHIQVSHPTAFFAIGEVADKEPVTILGFPDVSTFGFYVHPTSGPAVDDGLSPGMFSIYAKSCHGNSGGPVINFAGQVVGMLVAGYFDKQTDNGLCSEHAGALYLHKLVQVALALKLPIEYDKSVEPNTHISDKLIYDVIGSQKVVFIEAPMPLDYNPGKGG